MNLVVLLKLVPDTVEELNVSSDDKSLDTEFLRFKLSDPDEHALEAALLLKEKHGARVTVVALEASEVDDTLFAALAKGADRAVKLTGDLASAGSLAAAELFAGFLLSPAHSLPGDTLILVRSQAIDDLEGEVGPFLAERLNWPYVGVVTGIQWDANGLVVTKEFAGGWRGEFALAAPAILGIQSAAKAPRYVPIAKVRAIMKSGRIETMAIPCPAASARFEVERMYKPAAAGRAQMLEGTVETVADRLVGVLAEQSLI